MHYKDNAEDPNMKGAGGVRVAVSAVCDQGLSRVCPLVLSVVCACVCVCLTVATGRRL